MAVNGEIAKVSIVAPAIRALLVNKSGSFIFFPLFLVNYSLIHT
jgi:hypothetical protein